MLPCIARDTAELETSETVTLACGSSERTVGGWYSAIGSGTVVEAIRFDAGGRVMVTRVGAGAGALAMAGPVAGVGGAGFAAATGAGVGGGAVTMIFGFG